jgi:5-methylcytosine-specific restriction endonuclease McrA
MQPQYTTRICSKCGKELPLSEFPIRKDRPVGIRADCRDCKKQKDRAYYRANRDKILDYGRKYYTDNREHVLTRVKIHAAGNKDRKQKYYAEYHKKNAYKKRAITRQWAIDNPERAKRNTKVGKAKRRGWEQNSKGTFTAADIQAQYKAQGGKCWWCAKLVGDDYHADHRIPLSRGGSNAPENIVISCPTCNLQKGKKLPHEWNGRLL